MSLQIHPNVNRVFELDQGVAKLFGYEVIEASAGSCCITARVSNEFVNAAGFGHGSLAFTLMDTASAYALASTESMGVTVKDNVTCVEALPAGDVLIACDSKFDRSNRIVSLLSEALVKEVVIAHGIFLF